MLGIKYWKAAPTNYVIYLRDGQVARQGPGLSFFYFSPTSTIVDVPMSSTDVPFVFQEITNDFQEVTVQGQLTYRIVDAPRISQLIDFSTEQQGVYLGDEDPRDLLAQRLINVTQVVARDIILKLSLSNALTNNQGIVEQVLNQLRAADTITMLGIEIIGFSILCIKPTPEISRALEAEARESLQRRADKAIYERRNAAVEEERRIKESELNTQLAVETKNKQIRETRMAADIAIEEQRAALIDQRVENDRKDADSKGYSLSTTLKPLESVDWRLLMALSANGGDPRMAMSLAFQQLAENAGKIGQLNLTPDLLQSLMTLPERPTSPKKN